MEIYDLYILYINMYSTSNLSDIIKNKDKKELVFIHTPKCAGSYIANILSYLKIKNLGHHQAIKNKKYIYFTVIRNPIERFESLLNYRLSEEKPRKDWPKNLSYVYHDKNIGIDDIISKMSNKDILGFSPFRTITYWTKNVDIIITLDNLSKMLEYFGYRYDINLFTPINVSNKTRGTLNDKNKDRLRKIFNDDIELYNKVITPTEKKNETKNHYFQ
jgi:hypothetical protein